MSPLGINRESRVEQYMLARKSPWMLWRAMALRMGYVPPLVEGHIPDDIPMRLPCERGFTSRPKLLEAGTMSSIQIAKTRENSLAKHFIAFLLGLTLAMASFGLFKAATSGQAFHIPAVSQYVGR